MTMKTTPYIMLDGQAAEAIAFYESLLDAKVLFMQTFGEGPDRPGEPMAAEAKKRVAHCVLSVGEQELMVADTMPGEPTTEGDRISICLTADDKETTARLFDALAENGRISVPLAETYFSPAYGAVADRFGVAFQLFTRRNG